MKPEDVEAKSKKLEGLCERFEESVKALEALEAGREARKVEALAAAYESDRYSEAAKPLGITKKSNHGSPFASAAPFATNYPASPSLLPASAVLEANSNRTTIDNYKREQLLQHHYAQSLASGRSMAAPVPPSSSSSSAVAAAVAANTYLMEQIFPRSSSATTLAQRGAAYLPSSASNSSSDLLSFAAPTPPSASHQKVMTQRGSDLVFPSIYDYSMAPPAARPTPMDSQMLGSSPNKAAALYPRLQQMLQ